MPACESFLVVGKPEETLINTGRVCEWAVFQSGSLNALRARIGECRVQANHKEDTPQGFLEIFRLRLKVQGGESCTEHHVGY